MVPPLTRKTRSSGNTIIHVADAPNTLGPRRSLTNEKEIRATFTAYRRATQEDGYLYCICESAKLHKQLLGYLPHVGSSLRGHSKRIIDSGFLWSFSN
jgi:hypothetical protein